MAAQWKFQSACGWRVCQLSPKTRICFFSQNSDFCCRRWNSSTCGIWCEMFLDMHIWAMFSQPPHPRQFQSKSAEGGWVLPQNRFRSACLHLVSNTPHFNSHFLLLLPFRTTVLFLFLLLLFSNLSMHMFDHFLFSHFPSQVPRLDCIFSRAFSQLTLLHFLCFHVSFLTSLLKWNVLTISSLATFLHYHPCLLFFLSFLSLHVLPAFTSLFSRHSLLFSALVSSLSVLLFLFSIFSFFYFFQHFHFFTFLRLTPFLSYCFFTFASLTSLLNLHFFTFSSLTNFFTFSGFPRVAQCRQRLWRHGHRRRRRPLRCLQRSQGCRSHRSFFFVKFSPLLVTCFARWFLERNKSIEKILNMHVYMGIYEKVQWEHMLYTNGLTTIGG